MSTMDTKADVFSEEQKSYLEGLVSGLQAKRASQGLVPLGEGGPASERGDTKLGGRIPVNPSGGLESRGHPVAATGAAQIHELVLQLRGEADKRQVQGARFGLASTSGGFIGVEDGATCVTVLGKM